MTLTEARLITSEYDYTHKGKIAVILPNAMQSLKDRGWFIKDMKDYTMMAGIVDTEFGKGTPNHHVIVTLQDGEQVGFVPETIKIFPF